jgi:hypothetical protein
MSTWNTYKCIIWYMILIIWSRIGFGFHHVIYMCHLCYHGDSVNPNLGNTESHTSTKNGQNTSTPWWFSCKLLQLLNIELKGLPTSWFCIFYVKFLINHLILTLATHVKYLSFQNKCMLQIQEVFNDTFYVMDICVLKFQMWWSHSKIT